MRLIAKLVTDSLSLKEESRLLDIIRLYPPEQWLCGIQRLPGRRDAAGEAQTSRGASTG